MQQIPIVTSIGSCRVYDPLALLQQQGRVWLNQQNIYGFVHNSREVLQQLQIVSGNVRPAGRLRRFLNIRQDWAWRPPTPMNSLAALFAVTDCFVVEISSIRMLRYKAMFLQLNRTMEVLVGSDQALQDWWTPLLREGRNDVESYPAHDAGDTEREVVEALICSQQSEGELLRDMAAIRDLLPRPVLFVSHFNAGGKRGAIPQRQVISDTLRLAAPKLGVSVLDPTGLVVRAGVRKALLDRSHYRPGFVPTVAEALLEAVRQVLTRSAAVHAA